MKRSNAMIVKEAALTTDYGRWIQAVKDRVRNAQLRTMVAVNVEQLLLYWDIGHDILERQKNEGWGAKIIPRISDDLIAEFPNAQGFSPRNLGYMKRFAASWPRKAILQAPLAKLPWFSQMCKSRNRVVVEYALKNVNQPIAVSTYELEKMGLASPKTITDGLARLLGKQSEQSNNE